MKTTPIRKLIFLLLPFILAPMLIYTIYQVVQRNRQQSLIQSIYQQQLDSILLSINQNSWDRLNSWRNVLSTIIQSGDKGDSERVEGALADFQARYRAVMAVVIYVDHTRTAMVERPPSGESRAFVFDETAIRAVLTDSSQRIDRMFDLAEENYIRPIAVSWEKNPYTLLLVPLIRETHDTGTRQISAALLIDQVRYIEETVAVRIRETGGGLFDFAIRNRKTGQIIYSTADIPVANFEKTAPLWILPNMELLVKLHGLTLSALANRQTSINLIFLILVNAVLLLGVVFLIRNMAKEIQLAKQKTDFVANVSHELRTPLALIRMYAETLDMDRVPSTDGKKRYYRTIMNESARLTRLINNILDFAKIDAQKKEYRFEVQPLAAIVDEILDVYRFHLEQKGFLLTRQVQEGLPMIPVDREAVTQAVVNLLDNAVKYSGDDRQITVSLQGDGREQRLSVADRGIGIADSEQRKIFEKFYRVESSLTHNTRGSGLGLSLVEHIMAVHQGRVEVESRPGQGSAFTLVFPQKRE